MKNYHAELQQKIDRAVAGNDAEALDELLQEHFEAADESERPFDAAIRLKPEYRDDISSVVLESNAAFNWANRIARAKRRVNFRLKIAAGFDGLRIVSEGDSWWQYPLLLDDVIDHLGQDDDKAIYSMGAAGDLVERMAVQKEYLLALEESGAHVMLLSGGGNDLLGDGALAKVLVDYVQGMDPADLLDPAAMSHAVDWIIGHYKTILGDLNTSFPNVQVFGHAYDLPYPAEGGKWLGKPLNAAGIPDNLWRDVIRVLLDRFSGEISNLQQHFGNFTFVDLRGKVDRGNLSWHDELHPRNAGFGRAASEFRDAIANRVRAPGLESVSVRPVAVGALSPVRDSSAGSEAVLEASGRIIVLDPGHGGSPPPTKLGGSSWNNAIGPNGTLEKNLTLDVAKRARQELQSLGHTVFLTRDGDHNLSLSDRAAVAKSHNAPVFVSIHFNASNAHNAQGTETFVHPNHLGVSRRLCLAIQASMVAALGLSDRNAHHPGGIKKGSFGVINRNKHSASTACVLHEVSFLDRADEETRLQSSAYRGRIAKALADGVEAYLGADLEADAPSIEGEDLGDAIELAAVEFGAPVMSFLGIAEAVAPTAFGHVGGHVLGEEADVWPRSGERGPDANDDILGQILASETRHRARRASDDSSDEANDSREFNSVDIGEALDFASLGMSFESDVAVLLPNFAHVESSGFDFSAYETFIEGLGLNFFSPSEFLVMGGSNAPGGSCAGRNTYPPQSLWPRIADTAKMLDEIRRRLGAPVRILSCYRSPAYNACIDGASASLHMKFNAIDWRCDAGDVHLWHQTAKNVRSSNDDFLGGIGLYVSKRFIHVDTRGHEANF